MFPPPQNAGWPTKHCAVGGSTVPRDHDAAIVAIDARTGQQLWRSQKADYQRPSPTARDPSWRSIVIGGINGCELFTGPVASSPDDPDTGEELWHTSTLPCRAPGVRHGETSPDRRGGGDVWIAGSYDPASDLVYFGTSQPKPWAAPIAACQSMTRRSELNAGSAA